MDGDCMALVYEYMPEGTPENKLMGDWYLGSNIFSTALLKLFSSQGFSSEASNLSISDTARPLSWKQRVRIANNEGLEYLHKT
jgi:hypothetical protein